MSFVRKVILVGAAIALLPKEPEGRQQFTEKVAGAITWTSTYCERNAAHCDLAARLYVDMKDKAQFGFALIYAAATDRIRNEATNASSKPHEAALGKDAGRGTLTAEDVAPLWRGAAAALSHETR